MACEMLLGSCEDREIELGGIKMTENLKGLLDVLQQSINEAILESNDVAAAMAALKRTGKCPVFSIEVAMEEAPELAAEPVAPISFAEDRPLGEELVLSDEDVEFLAALGLPIRVGLDPSSRYGIVRNQYLHLCRIGPLFQEVDGPSIVQKAGNWTPPAGANQPIHAISRNPS